MAHNGNGSTRQDSAAASRGGAGGAAQDTTYSPQFNVDISPELLQYKPSGASPYDGNGTSKPTPPQAAAQSLAPPPKGKGKKKDRERSNDGGDGEGSRVKAEEATAAAKPDDGVPRSGRACLACRKLKTRCDGADDPPCKRCRTGGHECVFVESKRGKRPARAKPADASLAEKFRTVEKTLSLVLSSMNSGAPPDPTALSQLKASLAEGMAADATSSTSGGRREVYGDGLSPDSGSELGENGRPLKRARNESVSSSLAYNNHPSNNHDSPMSASSHLSPHLSTSNGTRLPALPPRSNSSLSPHAGPSSVSGGNNSLTLLADASLAAEIEGSTKMTGLNPSFNLSSVTQAIQVKDREEGAEERTPGLLSKGIIDPETAVELFRIFFDYAYIHLPLLDPSQNTATAVCARSPFLFTVICAVASRFHVDPNLHIKCYDEAHECFVECVAGSERSIESVQACMILTVWTNAPKKSEDRPQRAWLYFGMAVRMGLELGLFRPPAFVDAHLMKNANKSNPWANLKDVPEAEQRDALNRERTWLMVFVIDRNMSAVMGRPYQIHEAKPLLIPLHPMSLPFDLGVIAHQELQSVIGQVMDTFRDRIYGLSSASDEMPSPVVLKLFNSRMDEWRQRWCPVAGEPIANNLLFYFFSSKLFLNTFPLHTMLRNGDAADDPECVSTTINSAKAILDLGHKYAELGVLRHCPDVNFLLLLYAAVFLIKVKASNTRFAQLVDSDELQVLMLQSIHDCQAATCSSKHAASTCMVMLRALFASWKAMSGAPGGSSVGLGRGGHSRAGSEPASDAYSSTHGHLHMRGMAPDGSSDPFANVGTSLGLHGTLAGAPTSPSPFTALSGVGGGYTTSPFASTSRGMHGGSMSGTHTPSFYANGSSYNPGDPLDSFLNDTHFFNSVLVSQGADGFFSWADGLDSAAGMDAAMEGNEMGLQVRTTLFSPRQPSSRPASARISSQRARTNANSALKPVAHLPHPASSHVSPKTALDSWIMSLESRGGSALLLRLFESDFFNVHLAVGYLKTYPGSIGITHYLVQRLRSFDAAEVEFYWPQLCYLVVTRPTPSVALENFILERCEEDPHVAVITLWYLQSSLSDLAATPTTDQFVVCRRVYNRVQAIIFSDPPVPSSSTSGPSVPPVSTITLERPKVNAPLGVLMGMGLMAAGIGMAGLVKQMGQVAIDQSRRVEGISQAREDSEDEEGGSGSDEEGKDVVGRRVEKPLPQTGTALALSKVAGSLMKRKIGGLAAPKRSQTQPPSYLPGPRLEATPPSAITQSPISTESHSRSLSFLPSPTYPSASTSASRPTFARPSVQPVAAPATRRLPRSFDHTTMSSPSLPMAMHSASYLLSPSLPSTSPAGSTLPGYGYPKAFLSHLLLLQSCRTQLDLLRSLQDISTRLVLVPKQARLSSLRAELTVLNHGLPRGCCLGMACGGSSFSTPAGGKKAHARIVRISPSESAVLNSADRAPFVIHVEVLEGDLDFDPDRRQNAEDLRRALREREGGMATMSRRSGQVDPALTRGSFDSGLVRTDEGVLDQRRRGSKVAEDAPPVPPKIITSSPDPSDLSTPHTAEVTIVTTAPVESVPQEMDLVEQLYGDISIHSAPLPAIPDDPTIQNRSVDEQAWARVASPSPNGTAQVSPAGSRPPSPTTAVKTPRTAVTRTVTSLDDYAERMRMAAIMLAQLDASQAAVIGVVATGTAAAGTLVGLPVATVTGIGGVVGAGLGAVASRLTFHRRDVQAGQASTGVSTVLDTASAASGSSAIAGAPPLLSAVASTPTTPANTPPPPPAQRQRVLSPAEATAIRERIMSEMLALEEERMERMGVDGRARSGWTDGSGGVEDGAVVMRAVNKDDPSGAVFRESFASKTSRIRAASPYGHLATWSVISVIVKTGADLRQEQLAIQLVKEFGRIWDEEKCPSWVRYFRILVTSESTGLIETITDAVSVHSIKKDAYARTAADGTQVFKSFTLYDHYVETFGAPTSASFRKAQDAFVKSLASYSVICYLLSLKDRHNGNILVDRDGHLIHIDFGFLLSNSPGSLGFEMAPFKLPQDYIDILGGFESVKFKEFKTLFKRSFRDARKHAERIITLVELMQKDSNLPCFANGELTSTQLRERFQLTLTQVQADDYVDKLIMNAATSSFTRLYDLFQGYSNGIL